MTGILVLIGLTTSLAEGFPLKPSPWTPNTVTPAMLGMERVVFPLGANRTLNIPGLRRAAVGNSKVVRARAVPPNHLLLTAKTKGRTTLRTWDNRGTERVFDIEVLSSYLTDNPVGVIRVALEFLELSDTARQQRGVHWPEALSASSQALLQGTGSGPALTYTVGFQGARGWIEQLVQEGQAKLLASPQMYVRLGEQARFSSGGEIPIPTSSESFGRVQRQVEWKSFGISVKVKPESLDKYHILSDVDVELSELNPAQGVNGIPALNQRKLFTKINSTDGETILLSGLVRQLASSQEGGVPVLREIPILGIFFSNRSESKELQEILMAMTLSFSTRGEMVDEREVFKEKFHNRNP